MHRNNRLFFKCKLTVFTTFLLALSAQAAQPPGYSPETTFATATFDSTMMSKVDNELIAVKATLDAVLSNLAEIQRDDTALANASVHPSALESTTLALFASTWSPQGEWVTSTAYSVNDVVSNSGNTYLCAVAHTSGTLSTDITAGNWVQIGGGVGGTSGAIAQAKATAGAADVYTVDFDPDYAALGDVPAIIVTWHATNTGASTIQVDSLTAKAIKISTAAVGPGDLVINTQDILVYNATTDAFHVVGRESASSLPENDRWQIGDIRFTGRATEASGWLYLDGETISDVGDGGDHESADYETLFGIVKDWDCNAGTEVWATDTVTLCDMRGRVIAGLDNMGGASANVVTDAEADSVAGMMGEELHTMTGDELVSHSHTTNSGGSHVHGGVPGKVVDNDRGSGSSTYSIDSDGSTAGGGGHTHTVNSTGSTTPFNVVQPVRFFNIEVKYQ